MQKSDVRGVFATFQRAWNTTAPLGRIRGTLKGDPSEPSSGSLQQVPYSEGPHIPKGPPNPIPYSEKAELDSSPSYPKP